MRHSSAFVVIFSVALTLLGGTSWADEELEYAASGVETSGGDEDGGADLGVAGPQQPGLLASKRNLAALARSGRLPRFHYNKKLGPAASPLQPASRMLMAGSRARLLPAAAMAPLLRQHQGTGWRPDGWTSAAGDQALQGDAPDKMGVVEALGRLSEAAIFPYIGPHRWIKPWFSFVPSMRMRRDVSSGPGRRQQHEGAQREEQQRSGEQQQQQQSRAKRNVAALARNGWLPPVAVAAPSAERGTRAEFLRRFSGSQAHEASADEEEFVPEDEAASDTPDCVDQDDEDVEDILLVPSLEEVKRNLGHLARTGRLPPFNYRRPLLGADMSQATSPWPQARPKRLAKRCRPRGENKRNVAAMARKGALPRS
ncbi:neuropeptide-like precursor 1 isoform X1 [Amblyomma americanum]